MKVIIIGGGLGGLSVALTLSRHCDVTVLEKNAHLGGKMQAIDVEGFHFDYGPNTLTMPHVFWEVLGREALPFQKIAHPTHHKLGEHEVIFSTDVAWMQQQLARIDATSAANYPAFIAEITRLYELGEAQFLKRVFFSKADYIDTSLMRSVASMHPRETLEKWLARYFPHPTVRQLFARFATYIGSSPYAMPATFALIAYFELVEGTYYLPGGATTIARAFEQQLRQHATLRTNETVQAITTNGKRVTGVQTDQGTYEADIVISNMDYRLSQRLLGRRVPTAELSTSAYIELIGLKRPYPLHHHNVLFSADYEAEFRALRDKRYAEQPTVYSCYPYASDKSHPPALFVLINAPAAAPPIAELHLQVDEALRAWGIDKRDIAARKALPPTYIERTFHAAGGAIYGQASNSIRTSFMRPKNRDAHYKNLYYVGGTVHPGGGSPVVVRAGHALAQRLLNDC